MQKKPPCRLKTIYGKCIAQREKTILVITLDTYTSFLINTNSEIDQSHPAYFLIDTKNNHLVKYCITKWLID